jgi:hypothetical protein
MTVARQERKKKTNRKQEGTGNVLAGNPESGPLSTNSEQAFCEPGTGVGGRGETSDAANSKETGNKETGKAGDKARKGAEEEKTEGEEGVERLQRAAGDVVRLNCGELSQVLLGKAKEGHMGGFKLLMMLAERKKPREKPVKKARLRSQAMEWAAEEQWRKGMPEDNEEDDPMGGEPAG